MSTVIKTESLSRSDFKNRPRSSSASHKASLDKVEPNTASGVVFTYKITVGYSIT